MALARVGLGGEDDVVSEAAVGDEELGAIDDEAAVDCLRRRAHPGDVRPGPRLGEDRKSTRLNSSHANISYAVFCLKKKNNNEMPHPPRILHLTNQHFLLLLLISQPPTPLIVPTLKFILVPLNTSSFYSSLSSLSLL